MDKTITHIALCDYRRSYFSGRATIENIEPLDPDQWPQEYAAWNRSFQRGHITTVRRLRCRRYDALVRYRRIGPWWPDYIYLLVKFSCNSA